jgi:hypothetical protein
MPAADDEQRFLLLFKNFIADNAEEIVVPLP